MEVFAHLHDNFLKWLSSNVNFYEELFYTSHPRWVMTQHNKKEIGDTSDLEQDLKVQSCQKVNKGHKRVFFFVQDPLA